MERVSSAQHQMERFGEAGQIEEADQVLGLRKLEQLSSLPASSAVQPGISLVQKDLNHPEI